jgi:hypothetical protein
MRPLVDRAPCQLVRRRRQPLGDRGGIVVDHVVDTAAAVLDRGHRNLRCVGDGSLAGPDARSTGTPSCTCRSTAVTSRRVQSAVKAGDLTGATEAGLAHHRLALELNRVQHEEKALRGLDT